MKKIFISLTLFLSIVLLTSCLKNDTEYVALGAVKLEMTEELSSQQRRLHFSFFTEETFDCLNNYIRTSTTSDNQSIEIVLIDVEKTNVCLTGEGPAFASVDLGSFSEGVYPINIVVGDLVNSGTLELTPEKYVINFDNPQLLTTRYDTLNRIPDDIIWGLVGYYFAEADTVVNAFLDSLEVIGAVPRTLTPGDYGYFQTDTTGNIIDPENIDFDFSKTFIYDYAGSMEAIEEEIMYFSSHYYNYFYVYLYNSKGEAYNSNLKNHNKP